jgi:hypothetical protein
MGPLCCLEMSVRNYLSLRNNPKNGGSYKNEFWNKNQIITFDQLASNLGNWFDICPLGYYYFESLIGKNYLNEVIHTAEVIWKRSGRRSRGLMRDALSSSGYWSQDGTAANPVARDPCYPLRLSDRNDSKATETWELKVLVLSWGIPVVCVPIWQGVKKSNTTSLGKSKVVLIKRHVSAYSEAIFRF